MPAPAAGSVLAAAHADLVVLAVQWSNVAKALAGLPDWNGRVLIDATNPTDGPPDFKLAEPRRQDVEPSGRIAGTWGARREGVEHLDRSRISAPIRAKRAVGA